MKPNPNFPATVYMRAHLDYPREVAQHGLYCVAFFGHGRPRNLTHKRTTESLWRGLVRKHLRAYIPEANARKVD